jgi:hypothetical protein
MQPDIPSGPQTGPQTAVPGDQTADPGDHRHRKPGPARPWLTIAAAAFGIAGLAVSLLGVAIAVLPRTFSAAQAERIMAWEVAARWRTWPAGRIFPASVHYQLPGLLFGESTQLTLTAHRDGIAPQSGCDNAVDQKLAVVLDKRGCQAVLRATYTDATGSMVTTIGVAIMHSAAPQVASLPSGSGLRPGVQAVPFPGTLAAGFHDRQRQLSGAVRYGPYLILYTAGYTDGRALQPMSSNPYGDSEMSSLGLGVARSVGAAIGGPPAPPRCPGAPGC